MSLQTTQPPIRVKGGDILGPGFAITVAAWITAYLSRMPLINAPAQVTVSLMLAMVFFGGFLAARYSRKGLLASLGAGAVSGILNILILGSVLHDVAQSNSIAPAAALWIGGSILCNTLLAGLGGFLGILFPSRNRHRIQWTQVFALVLATATLPLITVGGLVTAFHAGLAVPDWPLSYGYNMFLFPLSRMQANHGNFYEHAHRLMGSLVGLTSLTVAIYTTLADHRRPIRILAWAIFAAVCIQGILGGTRVTERSLTLAILHGIFAQLVFASMACLAAATGQSFRSASRITDPSAASERNLTLILLAAMILQLTLGALLRHTHDTATILLTHILLAAVVATLAAACGFRAWGLYHQPPLKKTGLAIMAIVTLQLLLGIIALVFRPQPEAPPNTLAAFLSTAHQANGALLLALISILTLWTWRLLSPQEAPAPAALEPAAP